MANNSSVILAAHGVVRPLNWAELGSSAKDLWEERQLRSLARRGLLCPAPYCVAVCVDGVHDGGHRVS